MSKAGSAESVKPGTYKYLSCDQGYELSSVGHKKTFCRRDGTWSRSEEELAKCQGESLVNFKSA